MAWDNPTIQEGTNLADADYSAVANQFKLVKLSATGVVLAGAGELAFGSLYNRPASGEQADVAQGVCKVLAGTAGVARGNAITPEAGGAGVVAGTGDEIVGRALSAAAAGEFFTMEYAREGESA